MITLTDTGPNGERVGFAFVTKEIALELLNGITAETNRGLSRAFIELLKQLLIRGQFVLTNDALIIDTHNLTANAHHRLTAIVETGIGGWFVVILHADPDIRNRIDEGRERTPQSALKMAGYTFQPKAQAGTIKVLEAIYNGNILRANGKDWLWNYEYLQIRADVPKIEDSVRAAKPVYDNIGGSLRFQSAMHFLCAEENEQLADVFFRFLATGGYGEAARPQALYDDSSVVALRVQLLEDTYSSRKYEEYYVWFMRAWEEFKAVNTTRRRGLRPVA